MKEVTEKRNEKLEEISNRYIKIEYFKKIAILATISVIKITIFLKKMADI